MEMISRIQLLSTSRIAILCLFCLAVYNCIRSPLISTYIPGSDQARTVFNFTEFFHGRTLYILGDSTVVAHLKMVGHPYGVDRVNVERYGQWLPAGRFSNGYTIADYIAIRAGSPIPRAFLGILEEEKRRNSGISSTGINFASAECGILARAHQIEYWSLSDQILHLFDTSVHLDSTAVGKSLFFLSVGRDDYILFHGEKSFQYTKEVVTRFVFYLKSLYSSVGARNFVINNLAPIGCSPDQRRNQSSNSCDYDLNKSIGEFNEELESALRKFKEEYNATILLADIQKMFVEIESNPLKFGFTVIDKPCCGEWDSSIKRFQCIEQSGYCSNRNEYLFFDGTHPTDEANRIFADNCLAGRVCYPIHSTV